MSTCPPRWKAIRRPSGDQAGSSALLGEPLGRMRWRRATVSTTAIRPPVAKAIRLPSGAQSGEKLAPPACHPPGMSSRASGPRSGSGLPASSANCDPASVGRPVGIELVRRRRSEQRPSRPAGRRHDPEVEARRRGAPEHDPAAVGRPRRLAVAGAGGEPPLAGSVRIHHPDPLLTNTAAGKRDPAAPRRPRRLVGAAGEQPAASSRRQAPSTAPAVCQESRAGPSGRRSAPPRAAAAAAVHDSAEATASPAIAIGSIHFTK